MMSRRERRARLHDDARLADGRSGRARAACRAEARAWSACRSPASPSARSSAAGSHRSYLPAGVAAFTRSPLAGALDARLSVEGAGALPTVTAWRAPGGLRPEARLAGGLVLGRSTGSRSSGSLGAVALQCPGSPARQAAQRSVVLADLNVIVPPRTCSRRWRGSTRSPRSPGRRSPSSRRTRLLARPGSRRPAPSVLRFAACGLGIAGSGWVAGPRLAVTAAPSSPARATRTVRPPGGSSLPRRSDSTRPTTSPSWDAQRARRPPSGSGRRTRRPGRDPRLPATAPSVRRREDRHARLLQRRLREAVRR